MPADGQMSRPCRPLQWGHERALVEMLAGGVTTIRQLSFNGATSARSWKLAGHYGYAALRGGFNGATSARSWKLMLTRSQRFVLELQWGHERALVEIHFTTAFVAGASRFNGATSARSWK